MRIGDAEREAAVAALGEHYAAGRLTKDEFDERTDRAYAARTGSALRPLFTDLPPSGRPDGGPRPPQAPGPPGGGAGTYPRRSGGPWWVGGMMPLLLVVIGLSALTHLPFFLLLLVGWLVFAKGSRRWTYGHRRDRRDRRGPWDGPGSRRVR
jgi:hypothetical protein